MLTYPINKTKDWALVQNAALVGVEVSLDYVRFGNLTYLKQN